MVREVVTVWIMLEQLQVKKIDRSSSVLRLVAISCSSRIHSRYVQSIDDGLLNKTFEQKKEQLPLKLLPNLEMMCVIQSHRCN